MLIEVFVKVMTYRNQIKLQPDGIQTSPDSSLVPSVVFEDSKCTLGLNRAIHSQQGAVNAVEIVQNFLVNIRELLVEAHGSVLFRFLALLGVRTAAAILALIDFVLPSVEIPLDRLAIGKLELSVVWAE